MQETEIWGGGGNGCLGEWMSDRYWLVSIRYNPVRHNLVLLDTEISFFSIISLTSLPRAELRVVSLLL